MSVRKSYLFSLIGLSAVIVGLGFLLRTKNHSVLLQNPTQAIQRGLEFLETNHSAYHFSDPYLEYVYPGEAIACDLPDCRVTYRLLDAYFALAMFRGRLSTQEAAVVGPIATEQVAVFQDLVPRWRSLPLNNTLESKPQDANGIALDTYCILGVLEQDRAMAEQAVSFLNDQDRWLAAGLYTDDRWRNIADETWCLRLLAVTGVAADRLPALTERKAAEAREFLKTEQDASAKLGAIYHILALAADTGNALDQATVTEFQQAGAQLYASGSFSGNAMSLANLLEVLLLSGYTDRSLLAGLAYQLRGLQNVDGSWRVGAGDYPVFVTLRTLNALTLSRQHGL